MEPRLKTSRRTKRLSIDNELTKSIARELLLLCGALSKELNPIKLAFDLCQPDTLKARLLVPLKRRDLSQTTLYLNFWIPSWLWNGHSLAFQIWYID